ncbi:hypothetical protein D3C73_531940 [compost metagenome]
MNAGRIRHRQIHGAFGQLAVREAAARGGVHHLARFGGQLAHRHAEFLGAGLQHHGPGQRAQATHGRVAHAYRHAAAGDAQAVFHDHIGFARRRGLDHEGCRVGVQFFANDLRHGGMRALPAFHEGAEQAHRVVRADFQERRHLCAALCRGAGSGLHPADA